MKQFDSQAMYHVYNRGNGKRVIFHDEQDYAVFLSFLKYALLSDEEIKVKNAVDPNLLSESQQFNVRRLGLAGRLDLVAFCLMPNHFHLLLYQEDREAVTKLMRSVATGYVMYYNKRHNNSGSLFQGVYKASRIDNEAYWQHISRYIHLNSLDIKKDYTTYPYSSYRMYVGSVSADWVKPTLGMINTDINKYAEFVKDWIPERRRLAEIKDMVANSKEL